MKKVLTLLALAALATSASAQLFTNLLPGGDFENLTGTVTNADASSGSFVISYPTTGGNPDGAGVIEDTTAGGWAVIVLGNTEATDPGTGAPVDDAYSYANLGLVGGQPYSFQIDMRYDTNVDFTGLAFAGFKVEFWNQTDNQGTKTQTGDLRFTATDTNWFLASTNVVVPANKTHFKFVPLLVGTLEKTRVIFDNASIVAPATPIFAEIAGPPDGSTVATNYFLSANAATFPGSVTNVIFYDGGTLLGNDTNGPFQLAVTNQTPGSAALWCVAEGRDALNGFITATSATNNVTISATIPENIFYVDPAAGWISFAIGYEPSGSPRNLQQESYNGFYGSDDLQAEFSDAGGPTTLTLGPLVNGDTNCLPFPEICWYDYSFGQSPGDADAVGFNDFDAFHYAEPSGLNGNLITFKGTNVSLSLGESNNFAGRGWTCVAFVKDIAADGESFNEVTDVVTDGGSFSLSLATVPDPLRTVQYGFRTTGPNVMPAARDWYGTAVFESAPLPPPTNVVVDANAEAGWQSYINKYTNNAPGQGGFDGGEPWGVDAASATFGCDLTLGPLFVDDANPTNDYWYLSPPGGPGSTGNKIVEANTYVQDDSLSGQRVIFSGTVVSTGLLDSGIDPGGNTWTGVVFVKDLAPDYSSEIAVTVPLTVGNFSITNATQPAPGRHVQYGFAITGPNVWSTEVDAYGTVVIENVAPSLPTLTAVANGANVDVSFETCTGSSYTTEYKDNLDDVSWTVLSGPTAGTGGTLTVSDPANQPDRYYRVSVQ